MNYHNTIFPRIPVVTDREIKKNILIAREKRQRKRKNLDHFDEFVRGAKILALSAEVRKFTNEKFIHLFVRMKIGMKPL